MAFVYICPWGHGRCTAPDTMCPHWIGTYCELEEEFSVRYGAMEDDLK